MNKSLNKLNNFDGVKGPVLTVVMDGVGLAPDTISNAVAGAYTPTLDMLMAKYPMVSLKAHGTAVGLPSDDDMPSGPRRARSTRSPPSSPCRSWGTPPWTGASG